DRLAGAVARQLRVHVQRRARRLDRRRRADRRAALRGADQQRHRLRRAHRLRERAGVQRHAPAFVTEQPPPLTTSRLVLRGLRLTDAARVETLATAAVLRQLTWARPAPAAPWIRGAHDAWTT